MNSPSPTNEIALFVRVVEHGSFSAAAQETGLTPSGVSKLISRLESRLGVRLLERTTRRLALTQEGETFLTRGREVLAAVEVMEAEVTSARGKPRGLLRVNTGTAFAKHRLIPALPAFRDAFPEVEIDLSIDDRRIDVIGQNIDVTIRAGPLADSTLIARKLRDARRVICASKSYVQQYGVPETPDDLADHTCLLVTGHASLADWPMIINGRTKVFKIRSNYSCDNADILLEMVHAGLGIVRISSFWVERHLESGAIVSLLEDHHQSDPVPMTVLVPPGRQSLPRVRAFVDFLVERFG